MAKDPKVGLLVKLMGDGEHARSTGLPHEILVGREARKFLDRITGGKGSFMSFPYAQQEGAEPFMIRFKKTGSKGN